MAGLIETLTGSGKGLWLDHTGYAGRLLARGDVPWTAVDGTIAWLRQAQGLLKSDVIALPIGEIAAAWLAGNPELLAAMAARTRTVFPLKTLLGDPALRGHLAALFDAAGASIPTLPLVAVIPSPRVWITDAYRQAFPGVQVEIDEDAIDSAASYVADLLRDLPRTVVSGILLEEGGEMISAEILALYQPVVNVAAHYRWQVGIHACDLNADAAGLATPDFWIASAAVAGKPTGLIVPPGFWQGGPAPAVPPGGFRFARIPVETQPETVLDRLATLR